MRRQALFFLILAVTAGGLAAFLASRVLRTPGPNADVEGVSAIQSVVVAARDMNVGTLVQPEDVQLVDCLYPVSLFVHAFAVNGITPGTYEFLPHAHALRRALTQPEAETLRSPDLEITKSAFALTFVYNLYHNSRKYGDSGVVFGLIEVGAILQNLHLARTALGLAGCDQGSYDKQTLERKLGLDGHTRHVVHVTVVGQEE
jgi:SagB-type dehydrogenase family enzyme